MSKYPVVFMRGGTSKGLIFHEKDLPERELWNDLFVQAMGSPDPKQIDGMGGCVSSNNKIVIVRKSDKENVDVEYVIGQSIVGKAEIDYKSNCGNMTAAVAPFAVEENLISNLSEGNHIVRMYNQNTDKYINVSVPIKNGQFDNDGSCKIAGIDGTAGELKVNFLDPAGAKTGKLFPTGRPVENLILEDGTQIQTTIIDVSNPIALVRAEDLGLVGTELPNEIDANKEVMDKLEAIRGAACVKIGLASSPQDATDNNPGVPKVGFLSRALQFSDLSGKSFEVVEMDITARVISVFKCHKAIPLTAASSISVANYIPGTIANELLRDGFPFDAVRIGHPSGIMTLYPYMDDRKKQELNDINLSGVAIARTARRIMDGTIYIKD